jgi:hypothetical protein
MKTILLFCPPFSNYHTAIYNKLIEKGYDVVFEDSNLFISRINKFVSNNLKSALYSPYITKLKIDWNNYLFEKYSRINFDYFLLIKGEELNVQFLEKLRLSHANSYFVNYQWDSKKSYNYDHLIDHFDKVYSFDRIDCKNDSRLEYLPLFYVDDYQFIKNPLIKNDLFFAGANLVISSLHGKIGQDLNYLNRIRSKIDNSFYSRRDDILFKIAQTNNIYKFDFIIVNGKRKYKNINGFSYIPNRLEHNEIFSRLSQSRVVIDLNTPWQSGLTIRTIESLASGKRLITSNAFIKYEPFYNNTNILIFNPNESTNFSIPKDFVFSECSPTDMSNFSISSFLDRIIH